MFEKLDDSIMELNIDSGALEVSSRKLEVAIEVGVTSAVVPDVVEKTSEELVVSMVELRVVSRVTSAVLRVNFGRVSLAEATGDVSGRETAEEIIVGSLVADENSDVLEEGEITTPEDD
jgi:hypothetical protein